MPVAPRTSSTATTSGTESRTIARALNEAADLSFLAIHDSTPVEECERRDPKGLYARARAGELRSLTGIDAPYEAPENPDLAFDTTGADLDDLVARILAELARHEAGR
jgi:bifunctional enzyme CysN/CysC